MPSFSWAKRAVQLARQAPNDFFGGGRAIFLLGASGALLSCSQPAVAENDIPTYSMKEVAQRDGGAAIGGRMWCTFQGSVYDITDFVASHPGGTSKISLAAGKSLEPFWQLFPFHFSHAQVAALLQGMKVGKLDGNGASSTSIVDSSNPFSNDPARHPALIVHSAKPCNAEVPATLLTENFITPAELWFVRHHHPVPVVERAEEDFSLVVDARPAGGSVRNFSLAELRALPQRTIVATMQCSGNRRGDMNKVRPASGTAWGQGAVSTAEWSGPLLVDVLTAAGAKISPEGLEGHAVFTALDTMTASIPGAKVRPSGDVLLAMTMNGAPLPREHGFPVRAVVPGHVGVRNVKWVKEVRLSAEEAVGDWQRGLNYKVLPPGLSSASGVDLSTLPAMQESSVFSGITHAEASEDSEGKPTVDAKGWAWAGGGRGIARVDVTADGGKSWTAARVTQGGDQAVGRKWAWVFWEATDVRVDAGASGASEVEVASRAIDEAYNCQPEKCEHIWNMRGLANNSWYRTTVKLEK